MILKVITVTERPVVQKGKSKGKLKKKVVCFCNHKISERALYNNMKSISFNTSAVVLGNNTKFFISKNLMNYNNKLGLFYVITINSSSARTWQNNNKRAFKCRKLKRAFLIHSTFIVDGVVHLMTSYHGNSKKTTHMNRLRTCKSKHDWTPVKYLYIFASQKNTKAVAALKYFTTQVKFCSSYFY